MTDQHKAAGRTEEDRKKIRDDFHAAVNMTPTQLTDWLETAHSKEVGWGEGESVGHKSGRRIVELQHKKQADLSEDDYAHMQKVVGVCPSPFGATTGGRYQRDALALLADELGTRPISIA